MRRTIFFFPVVLAGFFCFTFSALAAEQMDVVINEVAWMGTASSTNDEWVELKNNTNIDIDLTGWTLSAQDGTPSIPLSGIIAAQGYFLLERSDDDSVPDVLASQIYTGALSNEEGEFLELRDSTGFLVDSVDCSAGWFFGDNDSKQTMERINPFSLAVSANWNNSQISTGTPAGQNSVYYVPPPNIPPVAEAGPDQLAITNETVYFDGSASSDTDGSVVSYQWNFGDSSQAVGQSVSHSYSQAGIFTVSLIVADNDGATSPDQLLVTVSAQSTTTTCPSFSSGALLINEIVSDPISGEQEWIEIFNPATSTIDLSCFSLYDGIGKLFDLSGQIASSAFAVFGLSSSKLNNFGDIVILKSGQVIIDQVVYGDWDDGDISDNAPVASDPYSIVRYPDGNDTDNDVNDFFVTQSVTKNAANIVSTPPQETQTDDDQSSSSGSSVSEPVVYTPENYNNDVVINEVFPNPAGADNENEFIELKNIGDDPVDLSGWIIRDNSSNKHIINLDDEHIIQPGGLLVIYRSQSNIALNNSGQELVSLYWPDNELVYSIEYFGKNCEEQSFSRTDDDKWQWTSEPTPGEQNIFIVINNDPVAVISPLADRFLVGDEILFDAGDSFDSDGDGLAFQWDIAGQASSSDVVFSYIFDAVGDYVVNLTVTDDRGASSTASIDLRIIFQSIQPQLPPQIIISEILPNPSGSEANLEFIELYNPNDFVVSLAGWQLDDAEGGSKSFTVERLNIYPGEYLVLERSQTGIALNNAGDSVRLFDNYGQLVDSVDYGLAQQDMSYSFDWSIGWQWTPNITFGQENVFNLSISQTQIDSAFQVKIALADIAQLEIGQSVITEGVVAVEPGVLGSQIFYLVGSGIQVYSYKKDFPDLKVGDLVQVSGEISESGGERRIKIAQADDIIILDSNQSCEPHLMDNSDIGEDCEGYLVTVTGKLIEKRGSYLYIDDGSDEARVYIKDSTGINLKSLNLLEGDTISVTGFVSQTKSGYRILPRYQSDIIVSSGQVMGVQDESLSTSVSQSEINKYLIAILIFMSAVIAWLVYQQYKTKKHGWKIIEE